MKGATALLAVAAASGLAFVALYLGGAPLASYDWLGLVPLIAGLGGAVIRYWRGGHLSGVGAALAMSGLTFWAGWLCRKGL